MSEEISLLVFSYNAEFAVIPLGEYDGENMAHQHTDVLVHLDDRKVRLGPESKRHVFRNHIWRKKCFTYRRMIAARIEKANAPPNQQQPSLIPMWIKAFSSSDNGF